MRCPRLCHNIYLGCSADLWWSDHWDQPPASAPSQCPVSPHHCWSPGSSYPECQICEAVWVAFSLLPDTRDISSICSLFCKVYLKFWTHAGAVSTVSYQDKDDTNKRFKNSFLSRSLIWPIPIICHFFHHINLHPGSPQIVRNIQTSNTGHTWHLAGDNGDNATLSNHWLVWNSMFVKHKLCQLMTVSMWSVLDRGTTTVYLQRWHLATNKVWHLSGAEKLEQEIWNRDSF